MSARSARRVCVGLVALSAALAVATTALHLYVGGTALPEGTKPTAPPVFVWVLIAFPLVGGLIASRRNDHPIGWLLITLGLLWQLDQLAGELRILTGLTQPNLPGAAATAWVYDVLWMFPVAGLPLLILLFPDGRLPSRRWGLAVAALGVGLLTTFVAVGLRPGPLTSTAVDNPVGLGALDGWTDALEAVGGVLLAGVTFASFGALVVRFRSGDVTTRQQVKWLLLAMVVILVAFVAADLAGAMGAGPTVLEIIRLGPIVLVPFACGIAVLRYRLFDIDLVVSRAIAYGALAAGIVGLYVAVVVGVGRLVGRDQEPNLALSVAATAVLAVAFDPARRRLLHLADRAVYGRRASPYETLATTARRVGAEYASNEVLDRMAQAIADATGGQGEVWIAGSSAMERTAVAPPGDDIPAEPVPLTSSAIIEGRDATFVVQGDDRVLGVLTVTKPPGEPLRPAERRLLDDLARAAALVLDNARLVDELRGSRQRLVAAQDEERRRVERDLHDGAQQRLLELALTLRRVERQMVSHGPVEATPILVEAHEQLQQALAELRDLARGIHPAILTEQGLGSAIESLVDRSAVPVDLEVSLNGRMPPTTEATAYFVTSEALANVAKHAAGSRARVVVTSDGCSLRVEIADDGPGGVDPGGHGLQGLADRVAAVGGRLEVTDANPGTVVRAVLPCG